MPSATTLIIGAGPAGLAMAARLRKKNLSFEVIEKSGEVAHSWATLYERLHLHTAKSMSALPFIPFPEDYPQFVSRGQLEKYLRQYANAFNVQPHFHQEVSHIKKEGQSWLVEIKDQEAWRAENVIVATGLNARPYYPQWPGMDNFQGEIIHSRDYRNSAPFEAKKVLVVGMGNTGAEIALDLAEHGIDTSIAVRSPMNIVPRVAFGRPTQLTALKLQKLPEWLQDILGKLLRWITIGNLKSYGIRTAEMAPLEQLRKTGKTPLIDLGTVKLIRKGVIKVKPGIAEFKHSKITFNDKTDENYDAVILATGYRSGIQQMIPGSEHLLDRFGNPRQPIGIGPWEGLYFLGFDNYRPGGILGLINTDSKKIADHLHYYRTPLQEVFSL